MTEQHETCDTCDEPATLYAIECGDEGNAFVCEAHRGAYSARVFGVVHSGWRVLLEGLNGSEPQIERLTLIEVRKNWWIARGFRSDCQQDDTDELASPRKAIEEWVDSFDCEVWQTLAPGQLTTEEAVAAERAACAMHLRASAQRWIASAERDEAKRTNVGDSMGAAKRAWAAENGDRAEEIERGDHAKSGG